MKRILLLLTLFVLACNHSETKQQRAQDLVKRYLDSTLNDPKSYESIKFEKLDTLKTIAVDDSNYKRLVSSLNNDAELLQKVGEAIKSGDTSGFQDNDFVKGTMGEADSSMEQLSYNLDAKTVSLSKQIDRFLKAYKPKMVGWKISHSFRTKNEFGALAINKMYFQLDSTLTKVTRAEAIRNTIK